MLTILRPGARLKATQTGYMLLPPSETLSPDLQRFLDAGPPPVYAGFGSMPVGNRERVSRMLIEATRAAGAPRPCLDWWTRSPGTSPTRTATPAPPRGFASTAMSRSRSRSDGARPPRMLDRAAGDRPVHVMSRTFHESAVSSAGLDALAIGRGTPDPPGGRIVRDRRGRPTGVLLEAARAAGQRLIVSRGWAELLDLGVSDDCLFVGDEPHAMLFPRVAAVIHHGGAGTVATAARAGVPQIVLPQAADQFLWRSQVVKLGLGGQRPRSCARLLLRRHARGGNGRAGARWTRTSGCRIPATSTHGATGASGARAKAPILRTASSPSLAQAIAAVYADPTYGRRAATIAAELRAAGDGVATTVRAVVAPASLRA